MSNSRRQDKGPNALELLVPSPIANYSVADARAEFAKATKQTARDPLAEQAFLASKVHIIRTHPTLQPAAREAAVAGLAPRLKALTAGKHAAPIPGGVGYGMFYNPAFKTNFATGTSIYWKLSAPILRAAT